ncbi:DUF3168 domain-containing protein [Tsuneonella mangrovi]|uniref:DUF3168 domain-containing protein n=1 Tax=Tsuneonella mangrovi TaxID=1982042 RepID=UPI000BA211EF|nr:DUF3168 domain-containing protein [Tsuneonella mangrovi]
MEYALRAALLDWLRSGPAPLDTLTAVEEEAPARTTAPWLAIATSASTDWSTKDVAGREVRIALELHTRTDDPASGELLASAIGARIESLPRAQNTFEVATILFLRTRTQRRANNARATLIEYRFRCLAA